MRSISLRLWLFAILSGVLQALPFPLAGPVPLWRRAFCWICLVPLLAALESLAASEEKQRWIHSAAVGYACGVVWYLLNCYWIEPTMHLYGGLPTPVAVGILILFAMYLGLYHGAFAVVYFFLRRRFGPGVTFLLVPFLWVAIELARTQITGFPWDLLGYTQVDHQLLTRLASFTGVMGLSLLVAAVNVLWLAPFFVLKQRSSRQMALAGVAALSLLLAVSSSWFQAVKDDTGEEAVLLQENLHVGVASDASTQPDESHAQMLASFVALSQRPSAGTQGGSEYLHPRVILWPEAPNDFFDNDEAFRDVLRTLASSTGAAVITDDVASAPSDPDGTRHLYNSARIARPDGAEGGRYDKMHLVPFGEYTPYKPLFFFAGHLLDDLPFVPGVSRHTLDSSNHRYGVFICYESIFGDEVRGLTQGGAQVLVNLSDDGWYGDSSAPWEHLDMARMRAIENNRWLLRSTNTGVTATIDPHGRIVAQIPRHQRASLAAAFGFRNGLTLYARYGDWLGWVCAAISAVALAASFFTPRPVH